jgi:hypothetical protein
LDRCPNDGLHAHDWKDGNDGDDEGDGDRDILLRLQQPVVSLLLSSVPLLFVNDSDADTVVMAATFDSITNADASTIN